VQRRRQRALATDSLVELKKQLEERTRELAEARGQLSEALEQQTATTEVLGVISTSPGELEPVFQAMLANAMRICEAQFGTIHEFADGAFRALWSVGVPPALAEYNREWRVWGPDTVLGQLARTKQTVHVVDAREGRAYANRDPGRVAAIELGGVRTFVIVPLLKEGVLNGAMSIFRQEVRPFTDKQIALVTNFAAQAVIAIENTRLLNELQQRTTDLGEALEQQTATSEVLKVISVSPGNLEPVFGALLDNAVRLCGAKFGLLYLCEGDALRMVGAHNVPPALVEIRKRGPFRPIPGGPVSEAVRTKRRAQAVDLAATREYAERHPQSVAVVELGGARSVVAVPMLKDGEPIGVIVIFRQEVRPFIEKQIELLTNFASQAVIAVENTRLLNELRQRTDDLSESLEQQMATSEVLQVISSSPGELKPVFEAMLENATRLCEASYGVLWLKEGDAFRAVALHGAMPPAYTERWADTLFRPSPDVPFARAAATGHPVHIEDLRTSLAYLAGDPLPVAAVNIAGVRTLVAVPMLKESEAVGVFVIFRTEVRSFTNKQIDLVKSFSRKETTLSTSASLGSLSSGSPGFAPDGPGTPGIGSPRANSSFFSVAFSPCKRAISVSSAERSSGTILYTGPLIIGADLQCTPIAR
jgi:GAF domain-containing protein